MPNASMIAEFVSQYPYLALPFAFALVAAAMVALAACMTSSRISQWEERSHGRGSVLPFTRERRQMMARHDQQSRLESGEWRTP